MKGDEFREIRRRFNLSRTEWMYFLGYAGSENTMALNCKRYERGDREIPLYLAQYVWLLDHVRRFETPPELDGRGLPVFPEWPDYYVGEEKTS